MTHYSEIEATKSRIAALRARFGDDAVQTPTTGRVYVGPLDVTDLVERPTADLSDDELVERIEDMGADLTTAQIRALRTEAGSAGDTEMVDICGRALSGCVPSRARCAQVIEAAEAMSDD